MKSKLIERIRNHYYLPPESKLEMSRKNVNICQIAIYALLAFGVSLLTLVLIFYEEGKASKVVYYSFYILLSLLYTVAAQYAKKKSSYRFNQTLVLLTCSFVCLMMYVVVMNYAAIISVLCFYFSITVMIIILEITPVFYTCAISVFLCEIIIISMSDASYDVTFHIDNGLFCSVLIFFSFYKRRLISIREMNKLEIEEQTRRLNIQNNELIVQKKSLLMSKQYLENTVFNQSVELQQQKEKIIKLQNDTIISLSNLAENRDEDFDDHILRTREYVRLIATKARQTGEHPELSERVINLYVKGAPLHDIGKIIVPDAILKKPEKLTEEEHDIIKLHTSRGGKIVEDVLGSGEEEEYVRIAKDMAMYHHEKYDGSGYPEGLKGDEIPLPARIMAVAATFDSLVSPRVYNAPVSLEEAFTILEKQSGTELDPALTALFIESKDEVADILNTYRH